jgi:peroxiredoxin
MNKILLKNVLGVVVILSFCSLQNMPVLASLGQKEEQAPDFSLQTVSGKTVALKDIKGKGTILFFFTTWCPYCRQKLPVLAKQYQKYQDEGLGVFVINAGESKGKVSSFSAKEHFPFDILLDVDMKTSEAYGVIGVPTFILISKDGLVIYEGNDMPPDYQKLFNK